MMLLRIFFLFAVLVGSMSLNSCSKVLSKRTDEQTWLEFDKEVKSSRAPASYVDTNSPSLSELHDALSNIPVRSMLLKCGAGMNGSVCYHAALVLQFDEVFRKAQSQFLELRTADYKREQKIFFEFRSYEAVTEEVKRFHQSILSGLELKARSHAKDLFADCESEAQKDSTIENFSVLSNLVYEMPRGTYACLSLRWGRDQKQLLDETSDRLGLSIVTEEAKNWIKAEQILPIYDSEVSSTVEKKAREELAEFRHNQGSDFAGVDAKAPQEKILKEWSIKLHEKYPYSPVEQWIVSYLTKTEKL